MSTTDQSGIGADGKPKVALLFGAGAGIGRATALKLHGRGWDIVIFDREKTAADAVTRELNSIRGGSCSAVEGDVTNPATISAMISTVDEKHGKLNLVVSTVGIVSVDFGVDIDLAALERMLSINTVGSIRAAQMSLPLLKQAREKGEDASLIIVTSVAGHVLLAERGGYSISKAALEMALRHLMLNWTASDIDVTGIAPGRVATDLVFGPKGWVMKHPPENRFRKVAEACGTQRSGTMTLPEDLARRIADLARPDCILRNSIVDCSDGWTLGFPGHHPDRMPPRFKSFLNAVSEMFPECEIPLPLGVENQII